MNQHIFIDFSSGHVSSLVSVNKKVNISHFCFTVYFPGGIPSALGDLYAAAIKPETTPRIA